MTTEEQMAQVKQQEASLVFDSFSQETAWKLGSLMAERAFAQQKPIIIDITVLDMVYFHVSCPGSNLDNEAWILRKKNIVKRFQTSTYAFALDIELSGWPFSDRGLDTAQYAASPGSFPITVRGTGVIGAITVSGMRDTDDHQFVVDCLTDFLK